ncbi:uncharacterized protein BXZ73DRAFT_77635 [Epithele typhae]|uniref:uncharacterized protein n=1 Tax=Epithele typhae TaxID=378194 RepID=UPI0020081F8E|nr:uncharacterized protein BXZ73DRAFT_77635 [Epithele typhae]KAH9931607.1 hypothetical protein BXZ73DRAFT_77635 [Epithele typhae]
MAERKSYTLRRLNNPTQIVSPRLFTARPSCSVRKVTAILSEPKPLTDQTWRMIRTTLVNIIEKERAIVQDAAFFDRWFAHIKHFRDAYEAFLENGRDAQSWKRTMPHYRDAIKLPVVRALLISVAPDRYLPIEKHEQLLTGKINEAAEVYRKRIRHDLATAWRATRDDGDLPPSMNRAFDIRCLVPSIHHRPSAWDSKADSDAISPPPSDSDPDGDPDAEHSSSDSDSDSNHDEDTVNHTADLALLERPTTLFRCDERFCGGSHWTSHHGYLEHLQTHAAVSGSIRPGPDRTTASELHGALAKLSEGREPRCACGQNEYFEPKRFKGMFGALFTFVETDEQETRFVPE